MLEHDGTPGYTDVDHHWLSIWPTSAWKPFDRDAKDGRVLFADWGVHCDQYYFDGLPGSEAYGAVFLAGAEEPRRVASDFEEFLEQVVSAPAASLW